MTQVWVNLQKPVEVRVRLELNAPLLAAAAGLHGGGLAAARGAAAAAAAEAHMWPRAISALVIPPAPTYRSSRLALAFGDSRTPRVASWPVILR